MKIRHTLLALLTVLAIAFMPPLVFFVGGLTLLLGVGALIFRDLPPTRQDTVERYLLGWLRRMRSNSAPRLDPSSVRSELPAINASSNTRQPERTRRVRTRTATAIENDPASSVAPVSPIPNEAARDASIPHEKSPPASGY